MKKQNKVDSKIQELMKYLELDLELQEKLDQATRQPHEEIGEVIDSKISNPAVVLMEVKI